LRASASAASTSARLRTISPAAAGGLRPRLARGLGTGFTGRPRKRTIAACLGFPRVLRFFVDIARPTPRIAAGDVCRKVSEKKVSLAAERAHARSPPLPAEKAVARFACIAFDTNRKFTWQNRRAHAVGLRRPSRMHKECAKRRACARASINGRQGYCAVKDGSDIAPVQPKAAAAACASGTTS
jgi:hypothetical protein